MRVRGVDQAELGDFVDMGDRGRPYFYLGSLCGSSEEQGRAFKKR